MWLLLACTPNYEEDTSHLAEEKREEVPWSPVEKGPYDAGLYSFSFVSSSNRELYVDVWYPANKPEVATRAQYEPFSFKGEAYREAPIAKSETKLLVFSHGLLSVRFQNYGLCEHLAQHGYTVIAPDHPGTSIFDLGDDILAHHIFIRPDDIQSTVDHFWSKVQDENDFVYGLLSSDQYIAMGHSLGSQTVMAIGGATYDYEAFMSFCAENPGDRACQIGADIEPTDMLNYRSNDPRAYAVIPMSPGLWYTFGEGLSNLRESMFVTGQQDRVLGYDTEAVPTLAHSPDYPELYFPKTGHYGFTEMCTIMPAFSEECTDTSGDFTEPEVLREALLGFVLAYIRGSIEEEQEAMDWLENHGWSDSVLEFRP